MKINLLSSIFLFLVVQSYAQIIPNIEVDKIVMRNGITYTGIIQSKTADSIKIKISLKSITIPTSGIDSVFKSRFSYPFDEDNPFATVTNAFQNKIEGEIISFSYLNNLKIKSITDGKTYELNWNQIAEVKTMDPELLNFDLIHFKSGLKSKVIITEIQNERIIFFIDSRGDKRQDAVANIKNIYLRKSSKIELPNRLNMIESSSPLNTFLLIGAGLSLPLGKYGEPEGEGSGSAEMGFNIEADIFIPFTQSLGLKTSAIYQSNSVKIQVPSGVHVDAENWRNLWFMSGPFLGLQNNSGLFYYIGAQFGVLLPGFPTQTYSYDYTSFTETLTGESDVTKAFGFNAGFSGGHTALTFSYLTSEPEIIKKSNKRSGEQTIKVDISSAFITLSYRP